MFSSSADDLMGDIVNDDDNECVDATAATWELLQVHMSSLCLCRFTVTLLSVQDNDWVSDPTATVTCDGAAACCPAIIVTSSGGVR